MFINIGNQHINVAHIAKIDPEAMTITTNGGEVFTATDRDSDLYRFILSGGGERMIPATAGWTYKLQRDGRLEKVAAWFISSSGNFLPVTVEGGFRWGTGYLATLISPDGQAMIDTSYLQGEFKPQMTVPVDIQVAMTAAVTLVAVVYQDLNLIKMAIVLRSQPVLFI